MTAEKKWYYTTRHRRKQLGPITFEELRQLADLGQIDRKSSLGWSNQKSSLIWSIGMHWIPYAALALPLTASMLIT